MSEYIEREALRAEAIRMTGGDEFVFDNCFPYWQFSKSIKDAPAADVAPVVHGEWVLVGTNEHDYETSVEEKCSLCGRYVYRYDTEPQDNYCPNCGAKIGKETNNDRND